MFFRSPVYGGALLDQPSHYEFKLHGANLSYDIPAGADGIPDYGKKVVNYRQKPEKFVADGNSGRDYYRINGASWVYYYRHILRRYFPQEIGDLSYNIGINKLPRAYEGADPFAKLEQYIWEFLDDFLEGDEGINTETRHAYPDSTDDELSTVVAFKPEKLERITLANTWLKFTLRGYPLRQNTYYYFTPLNDEYALSIEFKPYIGGNRKSPKKIIKEKHEKTMQMIMDSIKITFD